MTIEAISSSMIGDIKTGNVIQLPSTAPTAVGFEQWLTSEVSNTNTNIANAEKAVQQYVVGDTDNLHQVMISISKAQTSLELTAQVRNRLVEGFQEIMRMSI
ncbi:flagellar hook-basal body complex protein FliE [Gammaproteobacteria bacterium 42_54_T18]|nr:flagellar hook-basal body complex protein FliE [Gammaproteobacteria bacterium 42_54_T18]